MGATIKAIFASLTLAGNIAAVGFAAAQNYPNKPIRLIVPYPPGGGTDVWARMLAQKLAETFKQAVVVDNRPGASGTIGTETAVRARPDGYTMLAVAASYATNAALFTLPYDPLGDMSPIAQINMGGAMVALHPSVPVTSIKELVAYDKANPGKLNYGSGGTGSTSHLYTELLNQMAGTKMTHVAYKGQGLVTNDLLGGQIQLGITGMSTTIPLVRSNRLRGIAVTTAERSNAVPDIPTVAEAVPGYEAVGWNAVFGPKGLPQSIATRWNSEINRTLELPDVKERMAGLGLEPVGGSPEHLRDLVKREIEKWRKVVKTANIRPD
jgi:tripartite-type tricarboxylate transporter receptor subunit TctC